MPSFIDFNTRNKIFLAKTPEEFINFSYKDWIQAANTCIQKKGSFYVALSGGNTPLKIFEQLVKHQSELIDQSKIFLFWGDERCVLPTDRDSNYGQAMQILNQLNVPKQHLFRIEAEDANCAEKYQQQILSTVPNLTFDMIMLGMGNDGHTLSLFPDTPALLENKQLVVLNPVPQLNTKRITLTSLVVNKANRLVVYIQGEHKKKILHEILFENNRSIRYPIEQVTDKSNQIFWILSPETFTLSDFD